MPFSELKSEYFYGNYCRRCMNYFMNKEDFFTCEDCSCTVICRDCVKKLTSMIKNLEKAEG